uniref:Uncharacterized protein n=1 Tax=Panagrolaimus sp. ES5 TaxID=591445 RepID=A0AC34F862_9BILA
MRIRSLLKQLVLYAFPDRRDFIELSEAEIFKAVAAIPSHEFTEDNLFVAWFYARWILHLDRISRFPSITVKQTVANPAVQPDQVLLTAEQHGLCVQTTRPLTPIAAKFLQQLESLPVDKIRVPTENLNVWEENIEPNFLKSDLFIPMEWIIHRTRFDLFHANYAAAQFRTSRLLLKLLLDAKPNFSSVSPEIRDYISFDFKKLKPFVTCLGMKDSEQVKMSESLINVTSTSSIESQTNAVGYGDVITREMIVDEKARKQCLQLFKTHESSDVIETMRRKVAVLSIQDLDSPLCNRIPAKVPAPSEDYFDKFVISNPSLFGIFSTTKPDIFEKYFDANNKTKFPAKFPERYSYSEEIGDFISRVCPKELQPLLFLLIGKAKQLQSVSLFKNWEQIINFFLNSVRKIVPPNHPQLKEIQSLLILETVNLRLRPAYTTISFQNTALVEEITRKYEILANAKTLNAKSMLKFFRFYLPALINVRHFDTILRSINYVKDDVCYKFFTSFVFLLSHLNDNPGAKKDFFEQYVVILKLFSNEGLSKKLLFSSSDFLDMIENICEPVAIKQLLNYTLQVYNRWFLKSEDPPQHILLPDPDMKSCFILSDGYRLDSSDTRATGDYYFVTNNFEASLRFYLNAVLILTNNLAHPLTYNNVDLIDDLFWKKVSSCLIQVKRPTQAAITCQLITNMFEILPLIHPLLFSVDCEDASSDYFHLIGDIAIFEHMSAAYIRQGFTKLQQRLVEKVLSRAFHSNGIKAIHMHETLRRKSHWIAVLCSNVFDYL